MLTIINDTPPYVLLFIAINVFVVTVSCISLPIYHLIDCKRKNAAEKLQLLFRDLLYPVILDSAPLNEQSLEQLKSFPIHRLPVRKIFVSELMNYQIFLSGSEREKAHQIYLSLGLHHSAIKQLSGCELDEIPWALYELSRFMIPVEDNILDHLRHRRNKDIDMMINLYCIYVDKRPMLECIASSNRPFNQFEQLLYFTIITRKPNFSAPHFSRWISPEYHDSIIELCTDLAAYYYQDNATEAIHRMLHTGNEHLKKKLIRALGIFNRHESIGILMDCYKREKSIEIKKEIIKSLGYMSENLPEVNDFLQQIQDTESNLNLKKTSMLALYRSKSESAQSSVSHKWIERLNLLVKNEGT